MSIIAKSLYVILTTIFWAILNIIVLLEQVQTQSESIMTMVDMQTKRQMRTERLQPLITLHVIFAMEERFAIYVMVPVVCGVDMEIIADTQYVQAVAEVGNANIAKELV